MGETKVEIRDDAVAKPAQDIEQSFIFEPNDGSAPIVFPLKFVKPDKRWLWEMYNESFLTQSFEWMERAGVPKGAQRQAVSLSDDEYMRLFKEWFDAIAGGATPGE